LDYGWPVAQGVWDILPYAVIVGTLAAATLFLFVRRSPIGFLGVWFFLILAPTSSIMPITDLANDHRLYLSLAALMALVVIGAYLLAERLPGSGATRSDHGRSRSILVTGCLVVILFAWYGSLTVRRNADYHNEIMMWRDVISKRPANARAHSNLGLYLAVHGDLDDAEAHLLEALRLNPQHVEAHNNLGMV